MAGLLGGAGAVVKEFDGQVNNASGGWFLILFKIIHLLLCSYMSAVESPAANAITVLTAILFIFVRYIQSPCLCRSSFLFSVVNMVTLLSFMVFSASRTPATYFACTSYPVAVIIRGELSL